MLIKLTLNYNVKNRNGEKLRKKIDFSFVDIHIHILYGVDDGPNNINTSIEMIKTAYDEGTRKIVATPHYHPAKCRMDYEELKRRFEVFKEQVKNVCPEMQWALGREIYYTSDIPEELENGKNLMMGDSRYVLVEYQPTVDYNYMRTSISNIIQTGHIPLIAHIERYMCIVKDIDRAYELKNMGAFIQVNAGSVIGSNGKDIKKFIKKLMKDEMVDVIGTDAHSNGGRAPLIKECAEYVCKKFGYDYAKSILHDNAELILQGKYLEE